MMPVVRISDRTWERLKSYAQPFEDTPEKIINLALDALEKTAPNIRREPPQDIQPLQPKKRGNKLPQKEFRRPLLRVMYELGGKAEVAHVRSTIEKRLKPLLGTGDYAPVKNGDPRWWNATCWERKHLVMEGLFADDSERGVWELTEAGTDAAEEIK